ncbi:hypothetical protein IBX73_01540 [candidate division WOR-3 bacterium]|nr:hypothetical protein [candidate division WOR-3 bacterium]
MIPLLLFFFGFSQKQIARNPVILDGMDLRYASEYIFVTTESGIYTFDRNATTWKSITTAHGLPDNEVHVLGIDQGILWAATGSGLASADIRLADWRAYEIPGRVNGLAFDDQYVWVAGDSGLHRFDKFTETWETVDGMPAQDILHDQNYLWIAAHQSIRRYDHEFARIEEMQAASKHGFYHIINTKSRIWFLADDGFVAYERNTGSWAEHAALPVDDYANVDDSLFVVSGGRVYLYNPATNRWGAFVEAGGLGTISGISVSSRISNCIAFATDQGLALYDWTEKTRVIHNRASGMFNDTIIDAYEAANHILAIGHDAIQYYNKNTRIWQVEELEPVSALGTRILRYDEAGLHFGAMPDLDLKLQGRTYYSVSSVVTDSVYWRDYSTLNLRLLGQHASARTLAAYYDDTNKEDTLYGFGYRGLEPDFLYRANGGFIESEYYEFKLVPAFSTFGANARLRHRGQSVMLQAGQLKSSHQNDFFYGRSFEQENTVMDIDYAKNAFYKIPGIYLVDRNGSDTVFIDDRMAETNEIDTRIGFTVAGITGDFDPLVNGIGYYIDHDRGIIALLNPAGDDDIIVLWINGQEFVIQSDLVRDNLLVNIYALGPNIVPGSLELCILDTLGTAHSLGDFGIDNDDDGLVDPEFVNYRLGYLTFPDGRPFPDAVYEQQLHAYTMDYRFFTQSVFYSLSARPVMIGSEKVFVDGALMARNDHYSIDYTSGIVLFLSESVVSDFSEVEVQYISIEKTRTDPFYSVQPNLEIGERINIAPGYSAVAGENIFHLSGKYQSGPADNSIMLVPQIAVNDDKDHAQDHLLVANYRALTLNANYRGWSDGFEAFGLNERPYGRIEHSGAVSLGIEPLDHVRLKASLRRESLVDSLNEPNRTDHISGMIAYLNPAWPNGSLLIARNVLPDHENFRIQGNANYALQLSGNRIRLASSMRDDLFDFGGEDRKRVFDYTVTANAALRLPVSIDLYAHGIRRSREDDREKDENEVRLALNFDAVPGLSYTGNYQHKRETFFLAPSKDMSVRTYLLNNLNIAPGRWYAPLSVVNLSFGRGRNFDEYLDDLARDRTLPLLVLNPVEDNIATLTDLHSTYAKIFLLPFANLSLQLKRTVNNSGSGRFAAPVLRITYADEIRAEYELARVGLLAAVFSRTESRLYPVQTTTNTYLEWTKPWSAALRTKLSGNLRVARNDYATVQTGDSEASIRAETLMRFGRRSYVNVGLAARRQEKSTSGISNSLIPGCSVYLNMLAFLYLQIDYEANMLIRASTTHLMSAKITGSF